MTQHRSTFHFRRIDPSRNMARYYALSLQPTLFGETSLIRAWGRIGTLGQQMSHHFTSEADAAAFLDDIARRKTSKGYVALPSCGQATNGPIVATKCDDIDPVRAKNPSVKNEEEHVLTTTTEIAEKIASEHGLTKVQSKAVVETVLAAISAASVSGNETSLPGFGKFKVKATPEREARNPATGATIKVAAARKVSFVPAKALKDALNK